MPLLQTSKIASKIMSSDGRVSPKSYTSKSVSTAVDMETPAEVEVEEEEDNSSMLTIGAIAALLLSVCSLIIVRRKQSLNK